MWRWACWPSYSILTSSSALFIWIPAWIKSGMLRSMFAIWFDLSSFAAKAKTDEEPKKNRVETRMVLVENCILKMSKVQKQRVKKLVKKAWRKRKDRPATEKKKKRSCKKVKKRWLVEESSEHWMKGAPYIHFEACSFGEHKETDRDHTRGLKRLSKTVKEKRIQHNREPNFTSIFLRRSHVSYCFRRRKDLVRRFLPSWEASDQLWLCVLLRWVLFAKNFFTSIHRINSIFVHPCFGLSLTMTST